jgi:hypothetical protein
LSQSRLALGSTSGRENRAFQTVVSGSVHLHVFPGCLMRTPKKQKAETRGIEKIAFEHRYSKSLQESNRWRILQESAPQNTEREKCEAKVSLLTCRSCPLETRNKSGKGIAMTISRGLLA